MGVDNGRSLRFQDGLVVMVQLHNIGKGGGGVMNDTW